MLIAKTFHPVHMWGCTKRKSRSWRPARQTFFRVSILDRMLTQMMFCYGKDCQTCA